MTSKRTLTSTNETALLDQLVKPVYFARLDFSSGVERYHTEIGPLTATHPVHGAEVYTGIGDFGGIQGEIVESVSGSPQAVKLALTGVKSSMINMALVDDYYRRDVEVMIGLQDNTGAEIDDPEIIFSGFMDKIDIALSDAVGGMVVTCESRGTNLRRASDWRFTDEDKQIEVNGDLLGEYIYRMADLQLYWGDRSVNTTFSGGGGGGPGGGNSPRDRPQIR